MKGLAGRVAVVAGGAGGIGTATSLRLAEEGVAVVVADRDGVAADDVAGRVQAAGGRAISCQTDIGDEAAVADLMDAAVRTFGRLDVLHANAADLSPDVIGCDSNVVDVPIEVFDRTMHVNVRGHLHCARHAIPRMLSSGGGALVFTGSAAAFLGEPERPSYAMGKSALTALVRHIASRWGKEGIRANMVAPGLVLTDAARSSLTPEFRDYALRGARSPRLGQPEDIAAMVAFLASADAEWINGQVISVDGGASMR
jgi:NAD(P)-dependent dehydrogenase (short-subunit alcohol dehydrogenase family)